MITLIVLAVGGSTGNKAAFVFSGLRINNDVDPRRDAFFQFIVNLTLCMIRRVSFTIKG